MRFLDFLNRRIRASRRFQPAVQDLEARTLLSGLTVNWAKVLPDGRTVEIDFVARATDVRGVPDWIPGFVAGTRLTTSTGVELEHIGNWVTTDSTSLHWTAAYLINDSAQVISLGSSEISLSAGAGLLQDNQGNSTETFANVVAANQSLVDRTGFTSQQFQPAPGGAIVYVSATYGDDRRTFQEARNRTSPLKSLTKALDQAWKNGLHGKGGGVRLLRGDTFTSGGAIKTSGFDRYHPFVIEDYWYQYETGKTDPGTRPKIAVDQSATRLSNVLDTTNSGGTPAAVDHVLIRRIEMEAVNWSGDRGARHGIELLRGGRNWTIDDCLINNFGTNIVVQGFWGPFSDLTLLRSIITDARVDNSLIKEHTQGLFIQKTSGILISQCTFDNNGRVTADRQGRDLYSHNIYIKEDCGPAVVWGNVIRAGGSYGLELRSGGAVAYNYFGRNALAAFIDGVGGTQYKNVVEKAEDIGPRMPRGFGLQMTSTYQSSVVQNIEYNLVVNSHGNDSHPITIDQAGNHHIENAVVRHNTFVGSGSIKINTKKKTPEFKSVLIDHNLIDSHADFLFEVEPFDRWDFLQSGPNVLHSTGPERQQVRVGNDPKSLDSWKTESGGADARSLVLAPEYVNANADVGSFNKSMGHADSEADFVAYCRGRAAGIWEPRSNMPALYQYFARSYQTTNISRAGEGMVDEFGIGKWSTIAQRGAMQKPTQDNGPRPGSRQLERSVESSRAP